MFPMIPTELEQSHTPPYELCFRRNTQLNHYESSETYLRHHGHLVLLLLGDFDWR